LSRLSLLGRMGQRIRNVVMDLRYGGVLYGRIPSRFKHRGANDTANSCKHRTVFDAIPEFVVDPSVVFGNDKQGLPFCTIRTRSKRVPTGTPDQVFTVPG
jgi:hypothetical protein